MVTALSLGWLLLVALKLLSQFSSGIELGLDNYYYA